jgi:hypothetical protein
MAGQQRGAKGHMAMPGKRAIGLIFEYMVIICRSDQTFPLSDDQANCIWETELQGTLKAYDD